MFYNPTVTNPSPYMRPLLIDNNFDISGRFNIKTANQNNYGNFTWTKQNTSESLELRSPIGTTVARITVESGVATLTTKDKVYTKDDLDDMLEQNLGFSLPMPYLHYWIQGISLPDVPIDGELADGFIQLGWQVEYLEWYNQNHPKIIRCTKDDLSIKLLLEW
jgi:outer membrane lipoprotein LolB